MSLSRRVPEAIALWHAWFKAAAAWAFLRPQSPIRLLMASGPRASTIIAPRPKKWEGGGCECGKKLTLCHLIIAGAVGLLLAVLVGGLVSRRR